MARRVVILGARGMLGSMLALVLTQQTELDVVATVRKEADQSALQRSCPNISTEIFEVEQPDWSVLREADWVINATGVINTWIEPENLEDRKRAIEVNAYFPHLLVAEADSLGTRVIQIATDCVFSGKAGRYLESTAHDPADVYGLTKSLGEVPGRNIRHLRCSIIGPEGHRYGSLLEWFRGQNDSAVLTGFTNHHWNGITTLSFARLCAGIIKTEPELPDVQHIVPADTTSKYNLLLLFRQAFKRTDITVEAGRGVHDVDRTLATEHEGINSDVWRAAGYPRVPTIAEMVRELAAFDYPFSIRESC